MSKLADVMAYFCQHYPHKNDLSKARLTKMVYLADWKSAIDYNQQITNITWVFNHYGPYVDDIVEEAATNRSFQIKEGRTLFGTKKDVIYLTTKDYEYSFSEKEEKVLRHVIEKTEDLSWTKFLKLVYSTYPVLTNERYSTLDLVECAKAYDEAKKAL